MSGPGESTADTLEEARAILGTLAAGRSSLLRLASEHLPLDRAARLYRELGVPDTASLSQVDALVERRVGLMRRALAGSGGSLDLRMSATPSLDPAVLAWLEQVALQAGERAAREQSDRIGWEQVERLNRKERELSARIDQERAAREAVEQQQIDLTARLHDAERRLQALAAAAESTGAALIEARARAAEAEQRLADQRSHDKAAAEKAAIQRAIIERANERAAMERIIADKAAAEKAAADKAAADKAAAQKVAADKAAAEKAAADKAAAEKAAAEKAAAEKAAAEKAAAEKAAADKAAAEKAAAEKAADDKAVAEKAADEKAAQTLIEDGERTRIPEERTGQTRRPRPPAIAFDGDLFGTTISAPPMATPRVTAGGFPRLELSEPEILPSPEPAEPAPGAADLEDGQISLSALMSEPPPAAHTASDEGIGGMLHAPGEGAQAARLQGDDAPEETTTPQPHILVGAAHPVVGRFGDRDVLPGPDMDTGPIRVALPVSKSTPSIGTQRQRAQRPADEIVISSDSNEGERPGRSSSEGLSVSLEAPVLPDVRVPILTDDDDDAPVPVTNPIIVPTFNPADDARAMVLLNEARVAKERGDLTVAIQLLTDALEMSPDHADAYINRGHCHLDLGDYSSAMSDFSRAEDLEPNKPEPHFAMGNLYFNRKEYKRAVEFYDHALELDGSHAMARCRRGISHYYRKNYKQAYQDLQSAYRLDPEIPNIRKYVQMAMKKMDKPD